MAQVGEEEEKMAKIGSYGGMVRIVSTTIDDSSMEDEEEEEGAAAAAEEMMLLWGIQQPTLSKPNAFVSQSSLHLPLDACGRSLSILQSPSSLVTNATSYFFYYCTPILLLFPLTLLILIVTRSGIYARFVPR